MDSDGNNTSSAFFPLFLNQQQAEQLVSKFFPQKIEELQMLLKVFICVCISQTGVTRGHLMVHYYYSVLSSGISLDEMLYNYTL